MDNDTLRNMYANVLANAMNIDTKNSVHPSFVEIIKQLSPLDAMIFNYISSNNGVAMIHLNRQDKNHGLLPLKRNITDITFASIDEISISIDNLERLKLVEIPFDSHYSNKSRYESLNQLKIVKYYNELYANSEEYSLNITKKIIELTDLGKIFFEICVNDEKKD